MTSKEKIRDIKSVINEFYHNEKCEGKLTECARKSWLVFQEYCDDIFQDLERLEELEKENKILEMSVKDTFDTSQEIIGELTEENNELKAIKKRISNNYDRLNRKRKKLEKAIEIMRNKKVNIHFLFLHKLEDYNLLVCNAYQLTKQEYELLKEVLGE